MELMITAEEFGECLQLAPTKPFGSHGKVSSLLAEWRRAAPSVRPLYYARSVLGINFPHFLWLFHEFETAKAIE